MKLRKFRMLQKILMPIRINPRQAETCLRLFVSEMGSQVAPRSAQSIPQVNYITKPLSCGYSRELFGDAQGCLKDILRDVQVRLYRCFRTYVRIYWPDLWP